MRRLRHLRCHLCGVLGHKPVPLTAVLHDAAGEVVETNRLGSICEHCLTELAN